jgi:hypothetical protein
LKYSCRFIGLMVPFIANLSFNNAWVSPKIIPR